MVTINMTLFVELGLFLVFLWGISKFVLPRVLHVLDERERTIEEQHERSQSSIAIARVLEDEFECEMTSIRRTVDERIRKATHESTSALNSTLRAEKEGADAAVAKVRATAAKEVEKARKEVLSIAPEVAKSMADLLGVEKKS